MHHPGLTPVARRGRLRIRATRPLWAWAYVVAALLMGWFIPRIDAGPLARVSALRPEQVMTFLSSVSSGMMAFTGIAFALMFIVLQFGSTAYSPHVVSLFAKDPILSHAGGVFTGTFLYTLMALRGVGSLSDQRTGAFTVWVAFAWLLVSVYMLTSLVRVFASLEVTDVLYRLGDAGREKSARHRRPYSIEAEREDRKLRESARAAERESRLTQTILHAGGPLYFVSLDVPRLVELARGANGIIRVPMALGDSVTGGAPIAHIHSTGGSLVPEREIEDAVGLDRRRTLEEDPKHELRLLVDIAIRALSPAINDPTTAVHALDQIEAVLAILGTSHLDAGAVKDDAGKLRVVYETSSWEEYLELGVSEIQTYGAGSVQIERRLAALFEFLAGRVPETRRPALNRLASERSSSIRSAFPDVRFRTRAEPPDRQGLGHTSRPAPRVT